MQGSCSALCVQIQFLQGRWRLQLLHSILASWLNMAAAQAASRAHLSHTLQRVHMQQLLQAWSLAAQERIWLKSAALSAWRQCVHWQHLKPRLLSTALKFQKHRQGLLYGRFCTSLGSMMLCERLGWSLAAYIVCKLSRG